MNNNLSFAGWDLLRYIFNREDYLNTTIERYKWTY